MARSRKKWAHVLNVWKTFLYDKPVTPSFLKSTIDLDTLYICYKDKEVQKKDTHLLKCCRNQR